MGNKNELKYKSLKIWNINYNKIQYKMSTSWFH